MDIQIEHLVKNDGSFRALNDITLHVCEGMFGLLGPNGAGKTTLIILRLVFMSNWDISWRVSQRCLHSRGVLDTSFWWRSYAAYYW